jgi:hypothetical protein
VDSTLQHTNSNTLLNWLRSCAGVEADAAWAQYRIGTYPPGRRTELMYATCFWQIGGDDMPRSAKIIPYHHNGKRVKELGSTWIHSVITATPENPRGESMDALGIGQCLFGEHLLRQRPDALVAVVESEKSAVIGACFYPEVVWVATGGSNTFTVERCMALAGRNVVVFPDAGMYEDWLAHSIDISLMCESMVVSDILEAMGVPKGDDIADYLIHEQDGQYIQVVDLYWILTPTVTTPATIPQPLQDTTEDEYSIALRELGMTHEQAKKELAPTTSDPQRKRIDAWTNNVAQPWGNQQFMQTIAKSPMAEIFERPAIKELDRIFDLDKANATLKPYNGTA